MPTVVVSPTGDEPHVSLFPDNSLSPDVFVGDIDAAADVEYLTPQQIADLLKVSVDLPSPVSSKTDLVS